MSGGPWRDKTLIPPAPILPAPPPRPPGPSPLRPWVLGFGLLLVGFALGYGFALVEMYRLEWP